jgi:hypothetical protein
MTVRNRTRYCLRHLLGICDRRPGCRISSLSYDSRSGAARGHEPSFANGCSDDLLKGRLIKNLAQPSNAGAGMRFYREVLEVVALRPLPATVPEKVGL